MMGMNIEDDNSNWLGFSLSSHINTAPDHHQLSHQSSAPTPPASSTFYLSSSSHLNTSTCYGVAENGDFHSHSLSIMQGSSPKLEDLLGGAAMATYQQRDANAMFLSLDSPFYNQDIYQSNNKHTNSQNNIPPISEGEIPCLKSWIDHHQSAHNTTTSFVEDKNIAIMGCNELQSLSLSMSPASQSSCITASTKKRGPHKIGVKQTVHRKSIDTFGQRTSQYRGVTRHRWTGRYEAHLWDNSCKKEGQTRKGRQVYLGGYDMEDKAARAYDLAALKYWGPSTHINFPLENYHQELEEMKNMNRQEYVAHLRRKSSGFSRGASMYRGVTRHHQHGRWQARIGRVAGNKDLYLGTFSTQEEAAEAYDIAAIKFRGVNAVTNFVITRYDVERIMAGNALPAGETARRSKEAVAETAAVVHGGLEGFAQVEENMRNLHDRKMLQQNVDSGNYQNASFSVGLHDLISIASSHTGVVESTMPVAQQFSNSSSLVTSLSSSREASPDRPGASILYARANTYVNSWIPTAWHDV